MKKCLENYSEEELKDLLPQISYEIINIVYGYLHRGRTTVDYYCNKRCISKSTLYRYISFVDKALDK